MPPTKNPAKSGGHRGEEGEKEHRQGGEGERKLPFETEPAAFGSVRGKPGILGKPVVFVHAAIVGQRPSARKGCVAPWGEVLCIQYPDLTDVN